MTLSLSSVDFSGLKPANRTFEPKPDCVFVVVVMTVVYVQDMAVMAAH